MAGRGDDHRLGHIREGPNLGASEHVARGVPVKVPVFRPPTLAVGDDLLVLRRELVGQLQPRVVAVLRRVALHNLGCPDLRERVVPVVVATQDVVDLCF